MTVVTHLVTPVINGNARKVPQQNWRNRPVILIPLPEVSGASLSVATCSISRHHIRRDLNLASEKATNTFIIPTGIMS